MFHQYWDQLADFYDILYPGLWHSHDVAERILRHAHQVLSHALSPSASIVDVSCGTGHPAYALTKKGFRVTCADGSQRMLDRLAANFCSVGEEPPATTCCTWHQLPAGFPAEQFDVLLCTGNSICHLPPGAEGVETALQNFLRLLKPRGLCFLDVKKYNSRFEELNFNEHHTNLEVRWYRVMDVPATAGRAETVERRLHLLSEYDLAEDHRYEIKVIAEDQGTGSFCELGSYEFWPVTAQYLSDCLRRRECSQVETFDMRLTHHKYDFVVARKRAC